MLSTQVVTGSDWSERLRHPWRELAADSPSATPFQTWEWQSLWWQAFGGRKKPYLVAFYEGQDLVGLAPLSVTRGPWRALRWMGSGSSDYLHPLARPGFEGAVSQHLADVLREGTDFDLCDLHQIRETDPILGQCANGSTFEQARCLVLDLPKTFDAYLKTLGKSLRYDVKRMDRSDFADGKARIRFVEPDDTQAGMDVFFETHQKRWRKRGLPGAFVGRRVQRFHRHWAEQANRNGWLWLGLLEVGEKPVGAIYALSFSQTCFFYQAGFDPTVKALSPGTLLVAQTIRRAIEEGKERFDFLRGDEPYKRRWKPQNVYANVRWLWPKKGPSGSFGRAWNRAGWRVEAKVRERLEGRGLI